MLVPDLQNVPCSQSVRITKLPSLYYGKACGDIIEVYTYPQNKPKMIKSFLELDRNINTRGNSLKLKKSRLEVRSQFFGDIIVNTSCQNSLPDELVKAPSINSFKTQIKKKSDLLRDHDSTSYRHRHTGRDCWMTQTRAVDTQQRTCLLSGDQISRDFKGRSQPYIPFCTNIG